VNSTFKFSELFRVEQLGLLLREIDEDVSYIEDKLAYKEESLSLDNLNITMCREDWQKGIHNGDCRNFPATCSSCFWQRLVEDGTFLALALTLESSQEKRKRIAFILCQEQVTPEWAKLAADKFISEVDRLSLGQST